MCEEYKNRDLRKIDRELEMLLTKRMKIFAMMGCSNIDSFLFHNRHAMMNSQNLSKDKHLNFFYFDKSKFINHRLDDSKVSLLVCGFVFINHLR